MSILLLIFIVSSVLLAFMARNKGEPGDQHAGRDDDPPQNEIDWTKRILVLNAGNDDQSLARRDDVPISRATTIPSLDLVPVPVPAPVNPTNRPGATGFTWYPPGTAPVVAGYVLDAGMVYVGHDRAHAESGVPYAIDPSLQVTQASSQGTEGPIGYWPSYWKISPAARRRYLSWLASGKADPDAEMGFVYLYFYGLERRLLLEEPDPTEAGILLNEIKRLQSIYGHKGTFHLYSSNLLDAAEFLFQVRHGSEVASLALDPASASFRAMGIWLKVVIARKVVAGEALDFDLGAAGLVGVSSHVMPKHQQIAERLRSMFLELLRLRFAEAFPQGFKLQHRKDSILTAFYRGAAAGFYIDLMKSAKIERLPDPSTLTWTRMANLGTAVAEELRATYDFLGGRSGRAHSLSALIECPEVLRPKIAKAARAWIEALPRPLATVTFGELALHTLGMTGMKWGPRHHKEMVAALRHVGRAMEPNPEDSVRLADDLEVFVFEASESSHSSGFAAATVGSVLVAAMARESGERGRDVESAWLDQIGRRLRLRSDEITRLDAKLRWRRDSVDGLSKAKRLITSESVADAEIVAWSAAMAAVAGGLTDKGRLAELERIYDKVGVPRQSLYATFHLAAAVRVSAANEPVPVAEERRAVVHTIPRAPQSSKSALDEARIREIRRETQRVETILAEVFVEEPEQESSVADAVLAPSSGLKGLSPGHAALVERLMSAPIWQRAAFDTVARGLGLMPDGAIEAINEWSYDHYDEPLLEEADDLSLNEAVIQSIKLSESS